MTTLDVNEKLPDNGHDSASEQARDEELRRIEAESAAMADERRKRSPVYHVFEDCPMVHAAAAVEALKAAGLSSAENEVKRLTVRAWVPVQHKVNGATDRKAIESVIGTAENPVDGFDEKRRLHKFVAVLTRHWEPRKRKRTVTEDWA